MPATFGGGPGGGGGILQRTPPDDFVAATKALGEAARDAAITNVAAQLAQFDANPNLAISITKTNAPRTVYWQARRGGAWVDITNVVRGPTGPSGMESLEEIQFFLATAAGATSGNVQRKSSTNGDWWIRAADHRGRAPRRLPAARRLDARRGAEPHRRRRDGRLRRRRGGSAPLRDQRERPPRQHALPARAGIPAIGDDMKRILPILLLAGTAWSAELDVLDAASNDGITLVSDDGTAVALAEDIALNEIDTTDVESHIDNRSPDCIDGQARWKQGGAWECVATSAFPGISYWLRDLTGVGAQARHAVPRMGGERRRGRAEDHRPAGRRGRDVPPGSQRPRHRGSLQGRNSVDPLPRGIDEALQHPRNGHARARGSGGPRTPVVGRNGALRLRQQQRRDPGVRPRKRPALPAARNRAPPGQRRRAGHLVGRRDDVGRRRKTHLRLRTRIEGTGPEQGTGGQCADVPGCKRSAGLLVGRNDHLGDGLVRQEDVRLYARHLGAAQPIWTSARRSETRYR